MSSFRRGLKCDILLNRLLRWYFADSIRRGANLHAGSVSKSLRYERLSVCNRSTEIWTSLHQVLGRYRGEDTMSMKLQFYLGEVRYQESPIEINNGEFKFKRSA